ncbi:hypothetical protein [Streptomyces canus]|uniref:hypothetical protein n=1 Tax=Streptomyces canus TaxID=58343 RepID=UPI002E2EFB05|nr:hypothetical protein [Streptomyces canus]
MMVSRPEPICAVGEVRVPGGEGDGRFEDVVGAGRGDQQHAFLFCPDARCGACLASRGASLRKVPWSTASASSPEINSSKSER